MIEIHLVLVLTKMKGMEINNSKWSLLIKMNYNYTTCQAAHWGTFLSCLIMMMKTYLLLV